jgi:hypothetical protein
MKDRRLHYLSALAGLEEWSIAVATDAYGFACLTPDAVIAEVEPGYVASFDLQGRVRWRHPVGWSGLPSRGPGIVGPPLVTEGLLIVAVAGGWHALDEVDRGVLWWCGLMDSTTGPIRHGKSLIAGAESGFGMCGIVNPLYSWSKGDKQGRVQSPIVSCGAFVAATTSEGDLLVLDPAKEEIHVRQPGVTPNIPPLPAGDALLVAVRDGWMRFNLADKSFTRWLKIETAGNSNAISGPAILVGSSIYFSGDGGRLIRAAGRSGK